MHKLLSVMLALAVFFLPSAEAISAQIFKCIVNGNAKFQQTPCISNDGLKPPTVEELNAARQKKTAQDTERRADSKPQGRPLSLAEPVAQEATRPLVAPVSSFKCDGRKYCSQMTSCAEAKYFLANCPGVKMDGDGDGIPCEEQHCGH